MTEFTTNWFENNALESWERIFANQIPERVLEVGSYEGAATCWLLAKGVQHITCVDTWKGGVEHTEVDFDAVYKRFTDNIRETRKPGQKVEVKIGRSDLMMARMIAGNAQPFDFVYLDGSHLAMDVLSDACLAWRLLRPGGIMCFDDVVWDVGIGANGVVQPPCNSPRIAVEAFIQCHWNWISVAQTQQQMWVRRHMA